VHKQAGSKNTRAQDLVFFFESSASSAVELRRCRPPPPSPSELSPWAGSLAPLSRSVRAQPLRVAGSTPFATPNADGGGSTSTRRFLALLLGLTGGTPRRLSIFAPASERNAREGAARGQVPVWARAVGDPLRECRLQKLERSLPRCLGACWVVHLGAGFVHEGMVRLIAIDLEL
jgi:hypothetical protein